MKLLKCTPDKGCKDLKKMIENFINQSVKVILQGSIVILKLILLL